MGNRASRTEKEKDMALSKYVDDTIKNELTFKQSNEEVKSIEKAVNSMVDCIMDEVVAIDERFEMLRKVPVGSMAEGTRIVNPDEFDFMIVLKTLSQAGVIKVRRECKGLSSFTHAQITDDVVSENWKDVCKNGNLKSTPSSKMADALIAILFRRKRNIGVRELFYENIQKAVKELQERHFSIPTTEGTLSLKDIIVEIHGPAIKSLFNWHSVCTDTDTDVKISVDLVPVIEINDIHPLIGESDTCSTRVFQELERTGRVHLTPAGRISPCKQGMCFQIACTETEVNLVKSLNSNHKKCYKILKDMFDTRHETDAHMIISYVLKTLILKHASECIERELPGSCIMKILKTIDNNCFHYIYKLNFSPQKIEVHSVFFKEHDLFHYILKRLGMKTFGKTVGVFGSTSTQLIKTVNRVREEHPIVDEQTREIPNFRIKVQQNSLSAARRALYVLGLPLSYLLPMFVVYLPVLCLPALCASFHLPKFIRAVSLWACFIALSLLPNVNKWVCMLDIVCMCGRIILICWFALKIAMVCIMNVYRSIDILNSGIPFVYFEIMILWSFYLDCIKGKPCLIQKMTMPTIWDDNVPGKQIEQVLLLSMYCPAAYLIGSLVYIVFLIAKQTFMPFRQGADFCRGLSF